MKNKYEIRGEVTAIFIDSPKFGKFETLISTSKLEYVKKLSKKWYVQWNGGTKSFYVKGSLPNENGKEKKIPLHRGIMNAPSGMYVDHIDHDTLNNTDSNLRIGTASENQQNRKGAQNNSKSGVRGVTWDKKSNKWRAYITTNKVLKHLGFFDSVEDANHAAIEARMYHMPFSQEPPL